ncbi:MAG: hypothetical protein JEZ05_08195 [Tenericutes bacterium]|nr:hypothetical protein [Mycoplasmatota bacterium]
MNGILLCMLIYLAVIIMIIAIIFLIAWSILPEDFEGGDYRGKTKSYK